MKKLLAALLALCLCLTLMPAALAEEEPVLVEKEVTGVYHQTEARSLIEKVNDLRTEAGVWYWNDDDTTKTVLNTGAGDSLETLTYDYALEQIAMQRAAELVIRFEHTRPNGELCFTCGWGGVYTWGENIAYGYADAEEVFTAWREEYEDYAGQGHRRNMLKDGFTAVGMACFEYNGTRYWVQEFGYAPSNAAYTAPLDGEGTRTVEVSLDSIPEGSVEISASRFPDDAFRRYVSNSFDRDGDGWLSPREVTMAQSIGISGAGVRSLKGIEVFTELRSLDCSVNRITALDLRGNAKLEWLYAHGNSLVILDISACPALLDIVREGRSVRGDGIRGYLKADETGTDYWGISFDKGVVVVTGLSGGDVNDDGNLTGLDAALILQFAAGLNTDINTAEADMNGDGGITSADAARILKAN